MFTQVFAQNLAENFISRIFKENLRAVANVDRITKHDILHLNKGRLHRLVRALIIEPVDGQILKIKISVKKFSKIFKNFLKFSRNF